MERVPPKETVALLLSLISAKGLVIPSILPAQCEDFLLHWRPVHPNLILLVGHANIWFSVLTEGVGRWFSITAVDQLVEAVTEVLATETGG